MSFPSLILTTTVCLRSRSMSTHDYSQETTCATPQGILTRPRPLLLDAHATQSPHPVLERAQQVTCSVPSQCYSSNDQNSHARWMLKRANWTSPWLHLQCIQKWLPACKPSIFPVPCVALLYNAASIMFSPRAAALWPWTVSMVDQWPHGRACRCQHHAALKLQMICVTCRIRMLPCWRSAGGDTR